MNGSETTGETLSGGALHAATVPAADPVVLPQRRPWLVGRVGIWFWLNVRKIVVLVIGLTVILAGIAMLVLPGPGWVTIYVGISILATEFLWAKWLLGQAQTRLKWLIETRFRQQASPVAGREETPSLTATTRLR